MRISDWSSDVCSSDLYQTTGYYVSLLAGARGHKPLPAITTIQDLKLAESPRILNDEVDELIQQSPARIGSVEYVMNISSGQSLAKRHARPARALFNQFPAPFPQDKFSYRAAAYTRAPRCPIPLGATTA